MVDLYIFLKNKTKEHIVIVHKTETCMTLPSQKHFTMVSNMVYNLNFNFHNFFSVSKLSEVASAKCKRALISDYACILTITLTYR